MTSKPSENITIENMPKVATETKDLSKELEGLPIAQPAEVLDQATAENLLKIGFDNFLAANYGEHWKLTDIERQTLANQLSKVVNKYMVAYLGNYPEIVGLVLTSFAIVAPRIAQSQKSNVVEVVKNVNNSGNELAQIPN